MKGTKYMFLVLSKAPMFWAFAPRASLDATLNITGFSVRKVAFAVIVTGVSVIPCAIFASVLPVQGAMAVQAKPALVRFSASTMDFKGVLPVF